MFPVTMLQSPPFLPFYVPRLLKGLAQRVVKLEWCPTLPSGGTEGLRIAHLSDLHICTVETMEGGLYTQDVLRAAHDALHWALDKSPNLVVLTGDVTDSGLESEWEAFEQILADLTAEQKSRIVVIPGNHDLSITLETFGPTDGQRVLDFEERCLSYVRHVFENAPVHWKVFLWPNSEIPLRQLLESVDDYRSSYQLTPPYMASSGETLAHLPKTMARIFKHHQATHPWRRNLHECSPPVILPDSLLAEARKDRQVPWPTADLPLVQDLLVLAFPMIIHEDDQYVVVALNSNTGAGLSLLEGAIGTLGDLQLNNLEALLKSRAGKCAVVLIHHHLGCPPEVLEKHALSKAQLKVLQLQEARRVCDMLASHKPTVVLHGHKHVGYWAAYKGTVLLSGASVAYGDKLGSQDNCHVYSIEANGEVFLSASARIVAS